MTARQTIAGGRFVAVERGLWPKFDGWPFKRELEELAMRRGERFSEHKRRLPQSMEERWKKN